MSDATAAPGAEPGKRRAELRRRVLAALPLAAAALGLAYLGGPAFYALVAAGGAIMTHEWLRLTLGPTPSGRREPMLAAAGLAAITLSVLATAWVRGGSPDGRALMLWLLFVVWATDSGAFFVGRALKGPRLWPRISPKKTWSGALGGLGVAALVAIAIGHGLAAAGWTDGAPSSWRLALAGVLVGMLGEAGDLLESAAKRRYGVKDSGRLIPGHGGLLDRLDGFSIAVLGLALALLIGGAELLWPAMK